MTSERRPERQASSGIDAAIAACVAHHAVVKTWSSSPLPRKKRYDYHVAMSSPRSIRFEEGTLEKLTAYAARHPGLTHSSAAALLVEEGLRMDAHPGVVFRDGPAVRRAALAGGSDVWEVIRAIHQARAEASGDAALQLVADETSISPTAIRVAVGYYATYPDEIDDAIARAESVEREVERELAVARRLLDA